MKKLLLIALIALIAFIAYAIFTPSRFAPQAWTTVTAKTGAAIPPADRQALTAIQRLAQGVAHGPEDVAVDNQGRIYAGYEDGTIRRFDADGNNGEVFATTNGRPLGLAFTRANLFGEDRRDAADTQNTSNDTATPNDNTTTAPADTPQGKPLTQTLIVADADKGLLAIGTTGDITVLTNGAGDAPFAFTDDVDVASDGAIYFSDASSKYGKNDYRTDILEHAGHGRLLKYDPQTKQTTVLLSGLQFANGVAVGPDDAYVLVTETGSYRVTRYWLTGDRAGQNDIFIDNLPGFPDGISCNGHGTFWLALFAPRDAALDFMAPYPWLRKIVFRLPQRVQPQPAHVGHLLGINTDGQVIYNLSDDRAAAFAPITSVQQAGDRLYLGSLIADSFARLPVPEPISATP